MRRVLLPSLLLLSLAAVTAGPVRAAAPPPVVGGTSQAATGGPVAGAGGARISLVRSLLWATVNICDVPEAPNMMGVRASMPGNGTRQRMYMRFTAQWFSFLRQTWMPVAGNGVSPWIYAGSARVRSRQAGYTFSFDAPSAGGGFLLRGVVEYEWRARKARGRHRPARWSVARRARRSTRNGVTGVAGSVPAGQSLLACTIL